MFKLSFKKITEKVVFSKNIFLKKFYKKSLVFLLIFSFCLNSAGAFPNYFIFGLRLQENEYELVPKIEKQFGAKVPLVSLIYDDFNESEAIKLAKTFKTLGNERVYHISINPFGQNLKDLIDTKNHGGWERKYKALFRLIKKYDVKVIFRSLHEMNGGWYSRASDPYRFPIFWKMMWGWSREEGLTRANILFDFSINSQDLPAVEGFLPSQSSPVITCNQEIKIKTGCPTFEDYYPGDEYVDLVGVTIYNWGTGARKEEWAKWRDPLEVINEKGYYTLDRMKKLGKPIFIDEAGSTSIKINEPYNEFKLIDLYKESHITYDGTTATGTKVKNDWINKLLPLYRDSQVLGGAYFNADVTNGLNDRRQIGELDWTAIDPNNNFAYPAIINILNDYRNLEFPTFYFDLPDNILSSRKWIDEDEMNNLHQLVSKLMVYKEGNLIISGDYAGSLKYSKYQYYLEKQLKKDPVLCEYLKSKFDKIECVKNTEIKNYNDKKFVFDILQKRVLNSPILLSNWGVRDQIEQIKIYLNSRQKKLNTNSSKYTSYENMKNYLNDYEKNLLDLR